MRGWSRFCAVWLLAIPIAASAEPYVTRIAGTGSFGYNGDGIPAVSAMLAEPWYAVVGPDGNLVIVDANNQRIRSIDAATGIISTVAGTGYHRTTYDTWTPGGFNGDGLDALATHFDMPSDIAFDHWGNLYIADNDNNRVRRVDAATNLVSTIATGNWPRGLCVDSAGDVYFAESQGHRVWKVIMSTGEKVLVAGDGTAGFTGDGGPSTQARVNYPLNVEVDADDNLYIADASNGRIRKVDAQTGIITTVVGNGAKDSEGQGVMVADGVLATEAGWCGTFGMAFDQAGNFYFLNFGAVRKVNAVTGIVTTVVGVLGEWGYYSGDGPADQVVFVGPTGISIGEDGNMYIAERGSYRTGHSVYKVTGLIPVEVEAPDVTATFNEALSVPVQISNIASESIVSAEVFVRYDSTLLTFDQVVTAGTLTDGWTIEHNRVGDTGAMQILKIAAATDQDEITADGNLLQVQFTVNDVRHPASSPLTLTHVLLNDGDPAVTTTDGSVTLIGVDGAIASAPEEIIPRWDIDVTVTDADEDRDAGSADAFEVAVTSGSQTETVNVTETGASTGVFEGSIATAFSLSFSSDDGIVQAKAGDAVEFCYGDSLDSAGSTVERCATTEVVGGHDSSVRATVVSQPGDRVRIRVIDADLDESVDVSVANPRTGEVETILLSIFDTGSSHFYGRVFTDPQAGATGDSTLEVVKGDTLVITYADTLTSQGGTATRTDDDEVVDPFGDADGNGSVQAFDAARVLYHRLLTMSGNPGSLSGLDSLAANVDSLAPFGEIDPYDASLILQKVVGIFDRFQVQEPYAANQPQPETRTRPKTLPEERLLVLRREDGYLSVWAEERAGIVAGELRIEGVTGRVSMAEELGDFLVASRERGAGLQMVFAGAQAAVGPGELVRVYPGVGPGNARLTRASFNGGRIGARVIEREGGTRPLSFALYANAPNPFNPQTAIKYALPVASAVELTVYDIVGQQVRTLVAGQRAAGTHQAVWDGRNEAGRPVSSGVYFYRLTARGEGGDFSHMRRMLLLK